MCMTIVHSGAEYQVYTNQIETFEKLPAKAYYIEFSKSKGFFLVDAPEITVGEQRVYGKRGGKAKKIFDAFSRSDRSIGVILSGDKGIGKSLFARMLCCNAIDSFQMPVIIVRNYIPGISEFIESIEQECLVMFDEFDKTIGGRGDEARERQTEFIQLFDGIIQSKRLYVITCNNTMDLSEFFINRPGRFHYHIRFKSPDIDEITEYLKDKLDEQYWGEIKDVCDFSRIVQLNYDMLRAIAFELNSGTPFKEAIGDLNIKQENETRKVDAVLVLKDGRRSGKTTTLIDFGESADDNECVGFAFTEGGKPALGVSVSFSVWSIRIADGGTMVIDGKSIEVVATDFAPVATSGPTRRTKAAPNAAPDKIDEIEIDHIEMQYADVASMHDTTSFMFG